MTPANATDEELVTALRAGSRDAASELFRRHWAGTWRAAFAVCGHRAAADDVAQDAFERALTRIHTLNGHGSFGPWVQRIAVRRAIDHLRKERRFGPLTETVPDASEVVGSVAADPAVTRAVAALTYDKRLVIVLRYWLEYSVDEVAELLGQSVGTVSSRLSRTLVELRTTLEGPGEH